MKNIILSIGAVVLLVLLKSVWAADIFGNWIARVSGSPMALHESLRTQSNRTNAWYVAETVFSFKVNGTEVTGTITDAQGKTAIREGKINGDEISFAVVIGSLGGNEVKLVYKGKVALNEITFVCEEENGTGQPYEFIAGREFPRHGDIPLIQRTVPVEFPSHRGGGHGEPPSPKR